VTPIAPTTIGCGATRRDAPGGLFVRRYALLGVAASAMAELACLVYMHMTPGRPNRMLLDGCMAVGIALNLAVAFAVRSVVGSRWERAFFLAWSAATLVLIAVSSLLDGGAGSPLAWLIILPVVYASIDYSVVQTAAIGVAALGAAVGLMALSNDWGAQEWYRVIFVATFDLMAVAAVRNRRSFEVAEARLMLAVTIDGLTGCLNNSAFHERLRVETARSQRSSRAFSVLMSDADGFKAINDVHGHAAGDEALRAIGQALLGSTRAGEAVGRIGGDEFAVLLPDTSSEEAAVVARRIHAMLHRTAQWPAVILSIGVATWMGGGDRAADTLRRADAAMYEAKRLGGDRIVVWQATPDGGSTRRVDAQPLAAAASPSAR
jgi:diguanylate cyclase (GGDEF)-like protein